MLTPIRHFANRIDITSLNTLMPMRRIVIRRERRGGHGGRRNTCVLLACRQGDGGPIFEAAPGGWFIIG
ncbi:MAG TPA: hypothetical protein ENF52_07785 [Chloroflexi bacterium]|nr:hypothetical protein [Chloroflexota bacterium]